MAYSLQQSINWSQTFVQYPPLSAGTGNEPAISIANMILDTITQAPFTWGWNRNEYTGLSTVAGQQDYNPVAITDFGFLEKLSLKNAANDYAYEIKDVYNTNILGVSIEEAQPKSVCVKYITYGTSIALRFLSVPDQIYSTTITYQKLITPFSSLVGNWPAPDQYADIYNNLFLAEIFQFANEDQQAQKYRMRGIAALLSKSEGLTEVQRSAFLAQYLVRDSQAQSASLRTTQGVQARGI